MRHIHQLRLSTQYLDRISGEVDGDNVAFTHPGRPLLS
jgi:hypothetical protein